MNEQKLEAERNEQLIHCVPDIYMWDTLLYVGISKYRSMFIESFLRHGYKIDAIEVFKDNAEYWKAKGVMNHVVCADIKTVKIEKKYDVVMWYHGPEHVDRIRACEIFPKLAAAAERVLVVGCPWGESPQGPEYENENERHISTWTMPDLASCGFKVEALGIPGQQGSNLLGWTRK